MRKKERMESQIFFIICMLLTNFGSQHVVQDVNKLMTPYFERDESKIIILFAMCYVASRSIITSAIFTACIQVLLVLMRNFNKNRFISRFVHRKNKLLKIKDGRK